ncbi:MAG TPA: isocitrate lyase/phosphoenolpyruvate mutase family protein [Ktedonobacterales bacterium]
MTMTHHEKAEALLSLHRPGSSLLLPNAWDAASARLFEAAGFPALATTSAGIAYAHGVLDGERINPSLMIAAVARIVAAVDIPVTADIEAGYGPMPGDVARTVEQVIATGAVGINLEDSTRQPDHPLRAPVEQVARIAAAREAAARAGLPLVINARVDTFLARVGEGRAQLDETIERGKAYLAAGADCVFVPLVIDTPTIETLAREIPGPINVLAVPGSLPAPELFRLGVRRVSIGDSAMVATMGLVAKIAHELRETGTYEAISRDFYGFAEAKALFAGR